MKIFISYSRDDVEWAEKLMNSLVGHDVFFDKNSLRAGDNWETQILNSLAEADHLIVLWSKRAKESAWVNREVGHFDSKRFSGNRPIAGHLLLHILLDDTGFAYGSDQAITGIRDAGAYLKPAALAPLPVWDDAVDQIRRVLADPSLPVTLAVLTLTRSFVTGENIPDAERSTKCVDFGFVPPAGKSLDELLRTMNISRAQLADFYGARRDEWRPFGGHQSIREILHEIRTQLNNTPNTVPIRWVPVDHEFLSGDLGKIGGAANQLASGLSLVVFDPVALYSQWMRGYVQYLEGCLNNPHAIITVLPAFATPLEPRMSHAKMVQQVYERLVKQFYEEWPLIEHAQCSIFTADNADIRRLVRGSLRQFATEPRQGPASAFLGIRRG